MTQASLLIAGAAERDAGCVSKRTGKDLKEAGQAAALDAEADEWKQKTLFLFRVYLSLFKAGDRFAMEDFRAYADCCKHPSPHTHYVWGSLPAFLIKNGCLIRRTDLYRRAVSPRTHGHPVPLWEVLPSTQQDEAS